MKGDDIAERLLDFAARVIRLWDSLPKRLAGKHVGGQLAALWHIRPAPTYEEGTWRRKSRGLVVHKLGIARKEARESLFTGFASFSEPI